MRFYPLGLGVVLCAGSDVIFVIVVREDCRLGQREDWGECLVRLRLRYMFT